MKRNEHRVIYINYFSRTQADVKNWKRYTTIQASLMRAKITLVMDN